LKLEKLEAGVNGAASQWECTIDESSDDKKNKKKDEEKIKLDPK